jgi:phage terminase large subunit-like protein
MPTSRGYSPPCRPRFATARTPGSRNLAEGIGRTAEVLGFATSLGPGLMPWQHEANELITELDASGRLAHRQAIIEVMRQQGKSVDVLSIMIARGLRRPNTQIAYTAQSGKDARHRLIDVWWPRIRKSKLAPLIDIRKASGSEALLFANGSMLGLITADETSGHGENLDLGVIDEAWAQKDDRLEQAMRPAMMTRDAQLLIVSAAGNEKSAYFQGKVFGARERLERGEPGGCYIGYSAPDDADPGDPATWRACMPALGITVTEDVVASDYQDMDEAEFRRAYLCQWPEVAKPGWGVIGQDAWAAAAAS